MNFTGIAVKAGEPLAELYSPELHQAIQEAFARHINYDRGVLRVCEDLYGLAAYDRVSVISVGKGAHSMAQALVAQVGESVGGIVAGSTEARTQLRGFRYFHGGHPLPNRESLAAGRAILRYLDHVFPVRAGTESLPLAELVDRQHYRLAYWRVANEELNYRRFFDVGTLAAVRVEDPAVFDATHALLAGLVADGVVDGLRIDHPDGLADPRGYLDRPAAAFGSGGRANCKKLSTKRSMRSISLPTTSRSFFWSSSRAGCSPME